MPECERKRIPKFNLAKFEELVDERLAKNSKYVPDVRGHVQKFVQHDAHIMM